MDQTLSEQLTSWSWTVLRVVWKAPKKVQPHSLFHLQETSKASLLSQWTESSLPFYPSSIYPNYLLFPRSPRQAAWWDAHSEEGESGGVTAPRRAAKVLMRKFAPVASLKLCARQQRATKKMRALDQEQVTGIAIFLCKHLPVRASYEVVYKLNETQGREEGF